MGRETAGVDDGGQLYTTMSQVKPEPLSDNTHEGEYCVGCGKSIVDRYLLRIGRGQSWHVRCLRCLECKESLSSHQSCYFKDQNIFCRRCYLRQFGTKCARCCRSIDASDWVRRAKQHVYHLACFACDNCKRQLSTGEEFALTENRVLCKSHYLEMMEASCRGNGDSNGSECSPDSNGGDRSHQKTKRIRTTFTEEQLEVLQANFNVDSNPDGQDLERIAQITGLSKRVTQVWFQNSRARQKKHSTPLGEIGGPGGVGGGEDGYTTQSALSSRKISATVATQAHNKFANMMDSCIKCGMIYCLCDKMPGCPTKS